MKTTHRTLLLSVALAVGVGLTGCIPSTPRSVDVQDSASSTATPSATSTSTVTRGSSPAASGTASSGSSNAGPVGPNGPTVTPSTKTVAPGGQQVPPGASPTWSPSWSPVHQQQMETTATKAIDAFIIHKDSATAWKKALWPMFTDKAKLEWQNVRPAAIPASKITGSPVVIIDQTNPYRGQVKYSTNSGVWVVLLLATESGWRVDSIFSLEPQ